MEEIEFEKIFPLSKNLLSDCINKARDIAHNSNLSNNEQLLLLIIFTNVLNNVLIKELGVEELLNITRQIEELKTN